MAEAKNNTIVAIDGPAGAGKSTIARALAARLNFFYLDTGAMYRALTLKALREGLPLDDEEQLVRLARRTSLSLEANESAGLQVFLDGENVSQQIRTIEVTNHTFYIARAPRVREIMVQWQREMGRRQSVVMEGRDIGTVVFPDATFKFYLDADFQERAHRRIKELNEQGKTFDEATLREELKARDHKDFTRQAGPLKKADDAVYIDSTHLSITGVVDRILEIMAEKKSPGAAAD